MLTSRRIYWQPLLIALFLLLAFSAVACADGVSEQRVSALDEEIRAKVADADDALWAKVADADDALWAKVADADDALWAKVADADDALKAGYWNGSAGLGWRLGSLL